MSRTGRDDEMQFQLSQYVDGQLSPEQAGGLEQRLERDPQLREELRRYRALEANLAAIGQAEPEGVDYDAQRERIMDELARRALLARRPARRIRLRPFLGGLAAAAAVVLALTAWMVYGPTDRPGASGVPTGRPIVSVSLVPVAEPAGEGQVTVQCRRLDPGALRRAPRAAPLLVPQPPTGTVVVSFGCPAHKPRPPVLAAAYPLDIYFN